MLRQCAAALALVAGVAGTAQAQQVSNCAPDGTQASGSIYRICMPPPGAYGGQLVIWAHGFQDAGTPVGIPEEQLCASGICIPELVNSLGYAFATNSYSKTGLAILQGKNDLIDLVNIFTARHGKPSKVFLVGASEGGIITTLSVEQRPDVYTGGLAACGPIGDFPGQINYFGDARATFDFFFPNLIPGPAFDPHPLLVANWTNYYDWLVKPTITAPANRSKLEQWAAVAQLPADPADWLNTVEQSARDALRYSVVNLKDATATLGGFPYGNRGKVYAGSANDAALNAAVPRVDASNAALIAMYTQYTTTGVLSRPLVTLHTLRDQQIPYWHEAVYAIRTWASGAFIARHFNIPVDRYGHCNFTPEELLYGFFALLFYDGLVNGATAPAAKAAVGHGGIGPVEREMLRAKVRAALAPWRERGGLDGFYAPRFRDLAPGPFAR